MSVAGYLRYPGEMEHRYPTYPSEAEEPFPVSPGLRTDPPQHEELFVSPVELPDADDDSNALDREASSIIKAPQMDSTAEPSSQSISAASEDREGAHPPAWLYWLTWAMPRLILVPFLTLFFMWVLQAEGGVGLDESNLFGLHATLFVLFVVICTQEAILTYTVPLLGPLMDNRAVKKWFHLALHMCGMGLAIGGIIAIVYYKKLSPTPINFPFFSMYSPHSWVAVLFLTLWLIQLIAGFMVHLVVQSPRTRASAGKYHRFLGLVTYITGLATCALGFQNMQSSDLGGMYLAMNMTGYTGSMDMSGMNGYLYNSALADYSSACALLLVFLGIATTFAQLLK